MAGTRNNVNNVRSGFTPDRADVQRHVDRFEREDRDETDRTAIQGLQGALGAFGGPVGALAAAGIEVLKSVEDAKPTRRTPTERTDRRAPNDEDKPPVGLRPVAPADEEEEEAGRPGTDIAGVRARRRRVLGSGSAAGSATRRRQVLGL